jgi:hypothetical protein
MKDDMTNMSVRTGYIIILFVSVIFEIVCLETFVSQEPFGAVSVRAVKEIIGVRGS